MLRRAMVRVAILALEGYIELYRSCLKSREGGVCRYFMYCRYIYIDVNAKDLVCTRDDYRVRTEWMFAFNKTCMNRETAKAISRRGTTASYIDKQHQHQKQPFFFFFNVKRFS